VYIFYPSTDIRSSSPDTQAIPDLSSSNKGSIQQHSIGEIFPEIKGVNGKIATYYPNSSGVGSFGHAGFYVFEGEKVSPLYNLGSIDILKQLHHPNVIKPYCKINR
jgi:hypothetical protein